MERKKKKATLFSLLPFPSLLPHPSAAESSNVDSSCQSISGELTLAGIKHRENQFNMGQRRTEKEASSLFFDAQR